MNTLIYVIYGRPVSQKNGKCIGMRRTKTGRLAPFVRSNDKVAAWRQMAELALREQKSTEIITEKPLWCELLVCLDKGQRMDVDNAACAPLDALVGSGVIVDDSQINDLRVVIVKDGTPRVQITIGSPEELI